MKFKKYIKPELREMLESQYKEYIKNTSMTKKEQRVLREWVKDGHSVYENSRDAWNEGQIPVEFLTVYREEEYIRQHTKGMNPEDARKFAMEYYGWDNDILTKDTCDNETTDFKLEMSKEELPFQ